MKPIRAAWLLRAGGDINSPDGIEDDLELAVVFRFQQIEPARELAVWPISRASVRRRA